MIKLGLFDVILIKNGEECFKHAMRQFIILVTIIGSVLQLDMAW